MSVENFEQIDMIQQSRQTGAITLIISDHLPWNDFETHAALLQRKVERYLLFIKSGEILRMHPGAAEEDKIIHIYFMVRPPKGFASYLLDELERLVTRAGVGFAYEVFTGPI